jgi:hypothetical protein
MLTRQHFLLRFAATFVTIVRRSANASLRSHRKQSDPRRSPMLSCRIRSHDCSSRRLPRDSEDGTRRKLFFQNGFVEHNQRFIVTGRPDDAALSYGLQKSDFGDSQHVRCHAAQNATVGRPAAPLQRYPNTVRPRKDHAVQLVSPSLR